MLEKKQMLVKDLGGQLWNFNYSVSSSLPPESFMMIPHLAHSHVTKVTTIDNLQGL